MTLTSTDPTQCPGATKLERTHVLEHVLKHKDTLVGDCRGIHDKIQPVNLHHVRSTLLELIARARIRRTRWLSYGFGSQVQKPIILNATRCVSDKSHPVNLIF